MTTAECSGPCPGRRAVSPWNRAARTLLALALLPAPWAGHAAAVVLTTTDPTGTSSITNSAYWSNGALPGPANDYYTSAYGLRTPVDGSNYTFGGHSLTLQPGTSVGWSLIYKGTGASNVYTFNVLTNNGGFIRSGATSGNTCVLAGSLVVAGNATIQADQSPFAISANVTGAAIITNLNPAGASYGTVTYSGTNTGFTGELWVGTNGILVFANSNSVPANPASANPAQITLQPGATLQDTAGIRLGNANGGITLAGNVTFNTAASNLATLIAEPVTGSGAAITKTGPGALYLDAQDTASGTLTVSNGLLAGTGSIAGPIVVSANGSLGAGNPGATVGTLTVSNSLTLQGGTTLRINFTGGTPVCDQVLVKGGASYGGILTITNVTTDGTALTTNNTFHLFSVSGTSSNNFSPGILGSPGAGFYYTFNPSNGVLGVASTAALTPVLAHRYSFFNEPNGSLTATDTVAGANGTLQGGAVVTNGGLVLNGASGSYVNLPAGLINSNFTYTGFTFEAWANFGTIANNSYLCSFGNTDSGGAGEDYVFLTPHGSGTRVVLSAVDPGYLGEQQAIVTNLLDNQTNVLVCAVYQPVANFLGLYLNGVLVASNSAVSLGVSAVNDQYSYLGRSLYTADPYLAGTLSEFRMYKGALSASQIALDSAAGPTQVITNAGTLTALSVASATNLVVNASFQMNVLGTYTYASNVNMFAYSPPTLTPVNNNNVLLVTTSGWVTALSPGTATINVQAGTHLAREVVTVTMPTNNYGFNTFGDGFWIITNAANGLPLTAGAAGASQAAYTNGAPDQQFELLFNYQNGTFRIRQRSSWNALEAVDSAATNGSPVAVGGYSAQAAQQWILLPMGNGLYHIFNSAGNNVLQTDNGNPANVTLAAAWTNAAQLWGVAYQTHYPKKGMAGYEEDYAAFGLNWAYNYNDGTGVGLPGAVDFVPMIYANQTWQTVGAAQGLDSGWLAQSPPAYVLAYNEPDNATQANTTTNTAIANWPAIQALNVPIVGPACQNSQDAWENSFYSLISANGYRVDYAAVHEYVPPNSSSLLSVCQSVYNAYGRPVWLTEFSPVDWNGNQGWTEDDDYNFLAEFLWLAEGQEWFKRYAIFPFSGSNPNPPYTAVTAGYRGNYFESDGSTLTPYGELYATWDGVTAAQSRTPYLIHNLGSSFRLTVTNSALKSGNIYVRDATAQWGLLPAPAANQYYLIHLATGKRLFNSNGVPALAPFGTTNASAQWWLNGPSSQGYYYVDNLAASQSVNAAGTAPAIVFGMANDPAPSSATEWRFVKPYRPVTVSPATTPTLTASYTNHSATLTWSGNGFAFNVYRSTVSGGGYTLLAGGLTNATYTDPSVQNGIAYYYVVTALNVYSDESAYSAQAIARPASTVTPAMGFQNVTVANQPGLQMNWAPDHTGWRLLMNTNGLNALSAWFTVSNSIGTNQVWLPYGTGANGIFFRMVYP